MAAINDQLSWTILGREKAQKIHQAVLTVLEETGLRVDDPEIRGRALGVQRYAALRPGHSERRKTSCL